MPPQTKRIAKTWDQVYQREEVLPLHIAELRARIFQVNLKNLWQQFKKKDYRMWQSNRRHCNHHLHLSTSLPSSTSWSLSTFSKFPGTWMTRWPGSSSLESMRWETFFFISRAIFFLYLLFVNQYMRGELFSFSKVRWSSGFPSESIGISWRGIMSWQNMRAYKS